MDLSSYVDNLGREFVALVDSGGPEVRELVERASGSLEAAIRMTLLEALSAAADEITRDLAPGSVQVRLRGRDPDFVVTSPPDQPAGEPAADSDEPDYDIGADSATARINFRLPEQLKTAIEEAAGAEGRSVNAWLVRVSGAALRQRERDQRGERPGKRGKRRYTGWVS